MKIEKGHPIITFNILKHFVKNEKKTKNISIIGGGISGCVSAFLLSRKGYRVNLFERKNFLGGSIKDFTDEKNIFITDLNILMKSLFGLKNCKKAQYF